MLLSAELFSSDVFVSYSSGSQSPSSPPEGGKYTPTSLFVCFLKLIIKNNVLLMIQVEFKWKKTALLNIFFLYSKY